MVLDMIVQQSGINIGCWYAFNQWGFLDLENCQIY